jgi:hypothetical protein
MPEFLYQSCLAVNIPNIPVFFQNKSYTQKCKRHEPDFEKWQKCLAWNEFDIETVIFQRLARFSRWSSQKSGDA